YATDDGLDIEACFRLRENPALLDRLPPPPRLVRRSLELDAEGGGGSGPGGHHLVFSPPPSGGGAGGGGGWTARREAASAPHTIPPTLTLPHKGGGDRRETPIGRGLSIMVRRRLRLVELLSDLLPEFEGAAESQGSWRMAGGAASWELEPE